MSRHKSRAIPSTVAGLVSILYRWDKMDGWQNHI